MAAHQAILHVRWQGGATEDLTVALPLKSSERWRYPETLVAEVRTRALNQTDDQIAEVFRKEGRPSAKGHAFTASMIRWIRAKHQIPGFSDKQPGELTVQELSEKFGVSQHVSYYWLDRGVVTGRRRRPGGIIWIALSAEKEQELAAWVKHSKRICPVEQKQP